MIRQNNNEINSHYYLGIDAGGTKTTFKIVDESGMERNKLYKGACNPNDIGMDNAKILLEDGITEVCRDIPYSEISMFAGISGGISGNNQVELNNFFNKFRFNSFSNGSDIENIAALIELKKYILVIIGTGFVVFSVNGDIRTKVSGWGWYFDDGGSGYSFGRDAITAALGVVDGSGPETLIKDLIEERIGESVDKHLAEFYQGKKRYIASFSDVIFNAARKNDKVAKSIIYKNAKFISEKIIAAEKIFDENDIPVFFAGGITAEKDILFPILQTFVDNRELIAVKDEAVNGAILQAIRNHKNSI